MTDTVDYCHCVQIHWQRSS